MKDKTKWDEITDDALFIQVGCTGGCGDFLDDWQLINNNSPEKIAEIVKGLQDEGWRYCLDDGAIYCPSCVAEGNEEEEPK